MNTSTSSSDFSTKTKRGLNNSADAIMWELLENNLPISSLTRDQIDSLVYNYGEDWKSLLTHTYHEIPASTT